MTNHIAHTRKFLFSPSLPVLFNNRPNQIHCLEGWVDWHEIPNFSPQNKAGSPASHPIGRVSYRLRQARYGESITSSRAPSLFVGATFVDSHEACRGRKMHFHNRFISLSNHVLLLATPPTVFSRITPISPCICTTCVSHETPSGLVVHAKLPCAGY